MNNSEIRRITLQGMLLEGLFFFGFCAYAAFMVTTLIDYGWSGSAAAGVMTAMSVIGLLAQPFYGYIGDNFLSEKKMMVLLLAVSTVGLVLLPLALESGSKVLVLIDMVAITMTGVQFNTVMDAWIVGLKQEFPELSYGKIRGFGSFAHALAAQIMGTVTTVRGHGMRIEFGCVFILLAVFAALAFRTARRTYEVSMKERQEGQLSGAETFRTLFSSKQYCLLTAVSFLLLLSNSSMTILIQIFVRESSGTMTQIGTAAAISALSEVPVMFLMGAVIKKVGTKKLLIFCSIAYTVRMFVTASVGTVNGMLYVQVFQGITYAVIIPVAMSYLSETVDERVRSTAVTTFTAITVSFGGIMGTAITSILLAKGFSAQKTMIFFAGAALLGLILAVYGAVRGIWKVEKTVGDGPQQS